MDELGGTLVHSELSGMADHVAGGDGECVSFIRQLLEYLPSNCQMMPGRQKNFAYTQRKLEEISDIIPESARHAYDMHRVIECLIDDGSAVEIKPKYAMNIITLFARIGGCPVGIVANQSAQKAGCIDIDAADKAARFVRICDNFNIPLLNLVDVSGFYPGKEQEQRGIIRHGAKMLFAYSEAEVLKITVIIRKAYGGAYLAMCSKELGADMVYAWPGAEMAVMSAHAAVDVLYRNADREEKERYYKEYQDQFLNPYEAAHMGYVDEVIEPSRTRAHVLRVLSNYWEILPHRKKNSHKNIPL